jgi:hypothetical protein
VPAPNEARWLLSAAAAAAEEYISNIPVIAVPIDNVSAKPIPKVTSVGCAEAMFRSLCFIESFFLLVFY